MNNFKNLCSEFKTMMMLLDYKEFNKELIL